MLHRQPTIEEMKAALEASRLPPKEDFERMVREGLINRQGRVTWFYGTAGAEPEPEAIEFWGPEETARARKAAKEWQKRQKRSRRKSNGSAKHKRRGA